MLRTAATFAALAALLAAPCRASAQQASWNGYVQARLQGGPHDVRGFSIRRAKLWVKGSTPVLPHVAFKVQGIFKRSAGEGFTLQDAYAAYDFGKGVVRVGRMVPDFSLERSQPDALVPTAERAAVIDALIPSAETGARDVGVEALLGSGSPWHLGVGVFNGTGRDAEDFTGRRLLLTERVTLTLPLAGATHVRLGASGALRTVRGAPYRRILGAAETFSGRDLRWGGEARISAKRWSLQGEYVEARLEDDVARGFYVLAHGALTPSTALTASVERLDDLDPASEDAALLTAGLTRYLAGQDAKILVEIRTRPGAADRATELITQFQLFFRHFGRTLS